jgi:hypothetical protein
MEGMNQFRIQYTYTWKSHNETLCIAIFYLKQTKMSFSQKQRTGRQNSSYLGVGTSGSRENIRKGCRRMNMMEILCTHI